MLIAEIALITPAAARLARRPSPSSARWGWLLLAASLLTAPAVAAEPGAAAKPARKAAPAAKPGQAAKTTPLRQQLKSKASALALASSTAETLNAAQLSMAARVLTGSADCEFNQRISVLPVDGQPGWFTVAHKNARYRMLPQQTDTGAVRLEDKASGMVWLQIPSKSMLMNARLGQRLVDSCLHAEQRAAVLALALAGADAKAASGLGIVAPPTALAAAPGPAALVADGPVVMPTVETRPPIAAGLMPPGAPAVLAPVAPGFDTASAPAASAS